MFLVVVQTIFAYIFSGSVTVATSYFFRKCYRGNKLYACTDNTYVHVLLLV